MKVRPRLVLPSPGEMHKRVASASFVTQRLEMLTCVAAANGGRPFLRAGPISGRGRHLGMLASPRSSVADYSRLTTMQGKQKGNKGGIVRQKDQGYVDAVALFIEATTSPVISADILSTIQLGLRPLHMWAAAL